jgi:F-type H+-transporting ATPase subunit gamma
MTETTASLRRKIDSAGDLRSVVRTMKALAASSIGHYEESVRALTHYYRAVELGLAVCFREGEQSHLLVEDERAFDTDTVGAIVFGSDQGLVGRFNEVIAEFAIETLAALPGKPRVWAVGERVYARLVDAGLPLMGQFAVPGSVQAIAPLVGQIQIESEAQRGEGETARVYVFHNRPHAAALHEPVSRRLLPLDSHWQRGLASIPWPTGSLPEVMHGGAETLRALIREYLFIALFQACAESLASENASRLAAMERADRNIDELLEDLLGTFHRLRQDSIDAELFDLISGYESLALQARRDQHR